MNETTITHTTTDGRRFDDLEAAQKHQALLNKIAKFLDDEQVGESRRKKLSQMFVRWTETHENTVTEYAGAEGGA